MEYEKEKQINGQLMSSIEFAHLGGGELAYIKELTSDQAQELFPTITDLPKGINLYVLHAADGTPLSLSDTRSAAVGSALENDLEPVSVH